MIGDERRAGVLAHVSSIGGDLGPASRRFLDWLSEAGQGLWQVLPVGPTDGSPYAALSSIAGNPAFISRQRLIDEGWTRADEDPFDAFKRRAGGEARRGFEAFRDVEGPEWLDDWTLFATARASMGGRPWFEWPEPLRRREPAALGRLEREAIERAAFAQWLFARQWHALREEARRHGIALVGDVPFYPAHDSVDVWAAQQAFKLDDDGRARKIAGVPPDYFSEDGQLWGNPVHDWERQREGGYRWWLRVLRAAVDRFDLVRLDHFRGFAGYWEVDAGAETAAHGSWQPGPGRRLFDTVRAVLGGLPFVAEDLGDITDDVIALRDGLALPGMTILQFAYGEEADAHDLGRADAVAYTGTHDNDTLLGWWRTLDEATRRRVGIERLEGTAWPLIERLYATPAPTAIVPLQDLLGLGSEARMNTPGTIEGNWRWRAAPDALTLRLAEELRARVARAGRLPAVRAA